MRDNNKNYINLIYTSRVTLINIIGTISLSLIPFFIFVDMWAYDNADRSDIVARGPFLAGLTIIPSIIIAIVLLGIINYFVFKRILRLKYILLGILANIMVSSVLIFSGIAILIARLLDNIVPYGHYIYLALVIGFTIYLLIRYKNCAQQQV